MNPSERLWQKIAKYRWIFEICPFIREVRVVNSLARNQASEKSDIDLLVITEPKKVFPVRFFLTIVTQLWGVRVHGAHIAGRFCLSFFVDAVHANLRKLEYAESQWLKDFLETSKEVTLTPYPLARRFFGGVLALLQPIINWHTKRAFHRAQTRHFKNPSIVIAPEVFKFHENDAR